ncbi:hypothetical protein ABAC460_16405 [Asticcacaulis sp. AC460]|uniref:hypothetical protein n=1 Tax=Asticcacaulis sp. AC460 TaxID=1282360 RepID=UPI0003C40E30|nr:hypothetical protein [Asticcacaulis sp. AC460]ESQ88240.1 hypothetical protein ABAC460_16405 [Asticcacaulis sp. AC460]
MKTALIALALLIAAPAAFADEACTQNDDSKLPAAWQSWTAPSAVTAAARPADQPQIEIGTAYQVQLSPAAETLYDPAPKEVVSGSFGGLLMLTVKAAGDYSIALDSRAWVDVVRDGQVVESTSHGHGPACTSLRKKVVFPLTPGIYTIQLANAPVQSVRIEVAAGTP